MSSLGQVVGQNPFTTFGPSAAHAVVIGAGTIIDFNLWPDDELECRQDSAPAEIDIAGINEHGLACLQTVLERYMPGGRIVSGEYLSGSVHGGLGDSCSTNLHSCLGREFNAGGKGWNDPISLVAAVTDQRQGEAAKELAEFLCIDPYKPGPAPTCPKNQAVESTEQKKARARKMWSEGVTEPSHPYTDRKQVPIHQALRIHPSTKCLMVPFNDEHGVLQAIQRISPDGTKKALGPFSGRYFVFEGNPSVIYICEGYATAADVATATGKTTVMAVSTSNLAPVAEKLCKLYPSSHIVFAADNDPKSDGSNPGIEAAQRAVKQIGRGTVVAPPFPPGVKGDWNDYAVEHGIDETCRQIEAAVQGAGETPAGVTPPITTRTIDLYQWGAERWEGDPPIRKYLVSGRIPLGVAVMVAAMGDTGKSFILLALAVLVATGRAMFCCSALGGLVYEFGTAVVFTAEEDAGEVHSRVAALDPDGRRFNYPGKLLVVPLPDAGGPVSLIMQTREGLKVTPEFDMIKMQLMAISDLKMVVFDPLQNFVQTDINADPAAGQFACAVFAQLAAETGATVILPHHMRKSAKPIETVADARDAIRGTTALVDGLRAAYALWPVDELESKKICKSINVTWQPNRVVAGAVVKANGKADRAISTFIREDCGVLRDATAQVAAADAKKGCSDDQLFVLEEAIRTAAVDGQPFTKTGVNGLFDRRAELPESLRAAGRTILWQLADELLGSGRVVKAIHTGTSKKWLDVPGGQFATGAGMIRAGA